MYLYIGLAGSLGAVARYAISIIMVHDSGFPFSTLLVNLIGCYALAYLMSRRLRFSSRLKSAISTGFLGSFTTFSAFSVETITMIEANQIGIAILYMTVSIVGGIMMSNLGWKKRWDHEFHLSWYCGIYRC